MNENAIAAAYLELLVEIKHQVLSGHSLKASALVLSVDSDDVLKIAAVLRQHRLRVATNGEVPEPAGTAAGPHNPRLVTSADATAPRPCDPVSLSGHSIKIP